jgi:hypothetical protein
MGSGVGSLQEHMAGLSKGEVLPRVLGAVPGVGPALKQVPLAFGRQFQTALDVAKIEMWKAWREVTPKGEWSKTVQAIESVLMSGRQETAMVPHSRALLERVALLAPSYYRGAVNLVGALGESGVSGKVARRSLGAFILGSTALYYGVGQMLGMSQEDLTKRLNPSRTDFMLWDYEVEPGKKITFGIGGIFRSFARLAGNVTETSVNHPENWAALSPDKNPFTRWYRGHAGPTAGWAWTAFTGRDFLGEQAEGADLFQGVAPLALQKGGGAFEKTAGFVGLSAFERRAPTKAEIAEKMYPGKTLDELNLLELRRVAEAAKKGPKASPAQVEKTQRFVAEKEMELRKRVRAALPKEQQKWLEANGLQLPSPQTSVQRGGVTLPMSEEGRDFVEEQLAKFYQEGITKLQKSPYYETYKKTPGRLQERLDSVLSVAASKARAEWRKKHAVRGTMSMPRE